MSEVTNHKMDNTQLQLRWHSHPTIFTEMLNDLHSQHQFADVKLHCNGGVIEAHKAVLSLSSTYLGNILKTCSLPELSISLPEVPYDDVKCLISFIYKGQVDVPQLQITSFLNTGKHLQILGLEQGEQIVNTSKSDANCGESEEEMLQDNNNDGEKKLSESDDEENVDINVNEKVEVKLGTVKTEQDRSTEENQIDLNYYLHQAVQSASMPCPVCQREFKSQSGLRDHIRLHTGERPYKCEFCHMNFARASHLKRHRRMHTGEKPFNCELCGKEFSRGDKLKDHIRRHASDDKLQQIRKQLAPVTLDTPMANHLMRPIGSLPSGLTLANSPISTLPISLLTAKPTTTDIGPPKSLERLLSSSQPRPILPQQTPVTTTVVTNIGECVLRAIN